MAKQVIHLYGASGSGTSTIGKFISDKKGYFWYGIKNRRRWE